MELSVELKVELAQTGEDGMADARCDMMLEEQH